MLRKAMARATVMTAALCSAIVVSAAAATVGAQQQAAPAQLTFEEGTNTLSGGFLTLQGAGTAAGVIQLSTNIGQIINSTIGGANGINVRLGPAICFGPWLAKGSTGPTLLTTHSSAGRWGPWWEANTCSPAPAAGVGPGQVVSRVVR